MMKKKRPLYIPFLGTHLLETPLLNKSSAFSEEERHEFKLHGLIPDQVQTIEEQVQRSYSQFCEFTNNLDKHIYLRALQDANTTLFYKLICSHLEEMLPIVYTPTVGRACELFSTIYRRAKGLFLSYPHSELIPEMLHNVSRDNIRVVVITDGERILGLGDQGIGGMGIPIGKLSLYTACGGISPANTLPIVIDVGTNNKALLEDPMYMGWRHERIDGDEYFDFVDIVLKEIISIWPNVLIQFEDFALPKANHLLSTYRDRYCCFNDDIQGTAAVTLGTIISACRSKGQLVRDQRFIFSGAGSAGCGIAQQVVDYMCKEGLSEGQARERICMMNSGGLLLENNENLYDFQQKFAHPLSLIENWSDNSDLKSLVDVVCNFHPSVLVGVSGQAGLFSQDVIEALMKNCDSPLVLPLSNPTSRSEGHPEDIVRWSQCKAVVATGSPYDAVVCNGKEIPVAQCNNVYIFPGLGLGVLISQANRVTEKMLMAAALALAEQSDGYQSLLPPLSEIRSVSKHIAMKVAEAAIEDGVATSYSRELLEAKLTANFWDPVYRDYKLRSV